MSAESCILCLPENAERSLVACLRNTSSGFMSCKVGWARSSVLIFCCITFRVGCHHFVLQLCGLKHWHLMSHVLSFKHSPMYSRQYRDICYDCKMGRESVPIYTAPFSLVRSCKDSPMPLYEDTWNCMCSRGPRGDWMGVTCCWVNGSLEEQNN